MSVDLTVNGTTFSFPQQGEDPDWGEEVEGWASEVTEVLENLVSTNDILTTSFTLTNNQSSVADINGLLFSASLVRMAEITAVVRISTATQELSEIFKIQLVYENTAGAWLLSQQSFGDDSGIVISVTAAGQCQYTSTNVTGGTYVGSIKFFAKTIAQ